VSTSEKPEAGSRISTSEKPEARSRISTSEKVSYTLSVNGVEHLIEEAWYFETLLAVLRNRLGLTGAKFACGTGHCGACTVQIDGRPVNACLELAALNEGRSIVTIEGYSRSDGTLTPLQEALVTCADLQCGYCVPGIVMSAAALIEELPGASAEDVREGLSGNLCRCTAYGGFVEAIRQVAAEGGDR
jgi:aerobic-type carbon monoxide dehydrogenase small subunit (CoxS/CutS family)